MSKIYVQYVAHLVSLFLSPDERRGEKKSRAHSGEVTGTPSYNVVDKNIRERGERKRGKKRRGVAKYYNCRDLCGGK